jgi:phosphopantetheinyl transferase (holo-ACP synthase)
MRRFVDTAGMKQVRRELRAIDRISRALKGEAVDALQKVREIHFRLEDIYSSAMDFSAKEAFTKAFCQRLFDKTE